MCYDRDAYDVYDVCVHHDACGHVRLFSDAEDDGHGCPETDFDDLYRLSLHGCMHQNAVHVPFHHDDVVASCVLHDRVSLVGFQDYESCDMSSA